MNSCKGRRMGETNNKGTTLVLFGLRELIYPVQNLDAGVLINVHAYFIWSTIEHIFIRMAGQEDACVRGH